MVTDNNLQFIKEKITEIRTAIMYSMSSDLVKLPNSIVQAVKVDDEGNIWFVCKAPAVDIDQCAETFPVRLHFYRKGTYYHVEVSGKATIVNNEYTTYFADEKESGKKPLLIKMTMSNVTYTEPQEKKVNKIETWLKSGYNWLLRTAAVSHNTKTVLPRLQSLNQA